MSKEERHKTSRKRILILFIVIFAVFLTLLFRLAYIQLFNSEVFAKIVVKKEVTVSGPSAPRGHILDRNHQTIIGNEPQDSLLYMKTPKTTIEERLMLAQNLAKLIDLDVPDPKPEQIKEYLVLKKPEKAMAKLNHEEVQAVKKGKLSEKDLLLLQMDKVTEAELNSITANEKEVIHIKGQLDSAPMLTPSFVIRGVTEEEFAKVGARLDKLPGIMLGADWDRIYPNDKIFRSALGRVSSADQGLPKEKKKHYLSKGYGLSDRVGLSQLELMYEEVLQGENPIFQYSLKDNGSIRNIVNTFDGKRGNDIVLSIDLELQKKVEQIIMDELKKTKKLPDTEFLDRAYVVMMDPNNGEILTMAGKKIVEKDGRQKFKDISLGTVTSAYVAGSVVKGATLLAGYEAGVVQPGDKLIDEPLFLKDTPVKKSYRDMGLVNDLEAIEMSSNVYMFKLALGMLGAEYEKDMSLPYKPEAFNEMRRLFEQFGLGQKTGIDLPNESDGYEGNKYNPGFLLDLAIGQYDTYTPMQLVQYVSSIANGGKRIEPQLLKEIRGLPTNQGVGPVLEVSQPKVLNTIDIEKDWLERVRRGFKRVMDSPNGTASENFRNKSYAPAGKTGTGESYYLEKETDTLHNTFNFSFVGFAPYDEPKVAFSVVVPWLSDNTHSINKRIAERIMDEFFKEQ